MKINKEKMEKLDKRTIEYKTLAGIEYVENNFSNSFAYVMGYRAGNNDGLDGFVDEPIELYFETCYSLYKNKKVFERKE